MPPRLLLCALLSALLSIASAAERPAPTARMAPAPHVPLLWKVSDADSSLYLLGSFHLLKSSDYPLSKDIDRAYADAEKLMFEIAPAEMASPALGIQMAKAALRTDGTTLDSELPATTRARLATWTTKNRDALAKGMMTPEMLQRFEPWFVSVMVSLVSMGGQGYDGKLGLDQHFATSAGEAGKPTAGLETGAQQIAFLDGMARDEQLAYLDETLADANESQAQLSALHAAWRRGDEKALWDGMAADMRRRYPKLYQRINVDRNDSWLPRLQQELADSRKDDTLVVVGALHLIGSDGVVQKLRDRGYRVERICSGCKPVARPRARKAASRRR